VAITIDPATKRLILDSASVTAKDIFRAWADWMLVSDNAKYLPAFSATGGDELGGGLSIPPYYFLLNGWRVRPMEASHNLTITGNLFVEGGGVPVVSTLGTFQVNVNYTVPVQAQGISTSGGSGATAAQLWGHSVDGYSAEELLRAMAAVLVGRAEYDATTRKVSYWSVLGSKIRAVFTLGSNGNRTRDSLDVS